MEKNDSLLACRDTKLTYLLKSSFTVNHTNVMVCQISQRSKHAKAQVLPTLKFASRILQSTPDGMERLRAIGGKQGNRRDLLWVPSAATNEITAEEEKMDVSIDPETTIMDRDDSSPGDVTLSVEDDTITLPGAGNAKNVRNISSVTLMKPIMEMEGLEGKIKLNTPLQLNSIITHEGIMDNLEESIGSLAGSQQEGKIMDNAQQKITTEENSGSIDMEKSGSLQANQLKETVVSEISESRQPIYGENDDEGRKLAAKIDAKIKSIKFTFPRDSLLSNVTNIDPQASSERTQPSPDIHTHARRNMGEKDSLSQSPVQKIQQ